MYNRVDIVDVLENPISLTIEDYMGSKFIKVNALISLNELKGIVEIFEKELEDKETNMQTTLENTLQATDDYAKRLKRHRLIRLRNERKRRTKK